MKSKLLTIFMAGAIVFAMSTAAQAKSIKVDPDYKASTDLSIGPWHTIRAGTEYESTGFGISAEFQINLLYQAGILDSDIDNLNHYWDPMGSTYNYPDYDEYILDVNDAGGLTIYEFNDLTETVGGPEIKWTLTAWHQTILAGDIIDNGDGTITLKVLPAGTYRPWVNDPPVNNVEVFDGDLDCEVLGYTFTGAVGDIGDGSTLSVDITNTIASSTMYFETAGGYTLTYDSGSGTYSGVIPMKTGYGYDLYAKEGDTAWFGDSPGPVWTSQAIGAAHDGWPTWNPDTPDWYQYSLNLYEDGGQQKWAVRNHPGDNGVDDPWYDDTDGDTQQPCGVPLSGLMNWATMYAIETDIGAYLPGTGVAEIPGGAATKGGGAGAWDMDWSWGSEMIPLEFSGFVVNITDLGGGDYEVTLTPSGYSATFSKRDWDTIPDSPFDGVDGTHDGKFGKRDDGVLGSGAGCFNVDEAVWAWYQASGGYSDAWSDTGGPTSTGGTDDGFTENRWKFTDLVANPKGYYLKVVAVDLDNYAFQKPYSIYPTHWTADPAVGGRYKWPEEWEIETDIGAAGTFTGTRVLLNIAPDATNGYVSTTTALLPSLTEGDVVIGINGTYFPDIELPDWPASYAWNGSQQHGIQLSELTLNPIPVNTLYLDVAAPSLYVQPGENVITDMDVMNLAQKVVACQAILGYSSTYLQASAGCVIPGGAPWDDLIYNSWDIPGADVPGEIDTAIGIDANSITTGTDADNTIAVIALSALIEGTTQIVFREDVDDIESTYLADMGAQAVWPTKFNSQTIVIDGTNPDVTVDYPNGGEILKGGDICTILWTATDLNIDYDSVKIEYYNGSVWVEEATGEDNDGSYDWTLPGLDIATASVRVTVSDLAGNSASDESDAAFTIDSTDPVVVDIKASQSGGPDLTPSGNGNAVQGPVVDIAVQTSDNLSGIAGAPTVTVVDSDTAAMTVTYVGESPLNTFNYTVTVQPTTANGAATITVSGLTDNAGNVAGNVTDTFDINKNQITGSVELDSLNPPGGGITRTVTFVANGGTKMWDIPVDFAAGSTTGSYTLTDVAGDTTTLSAKAAWNLRVKITGLDLTDADGQEVVNFTGSDKLRGGDLNGSNTTNILDFAVLKINWFTTNAVADINGDGSVQLWDFLILRSNFFKRGDAL